MIEVAKNNSDCGLRSEYANIAINEVIYPIYPRTMGPNDLGLKPN